MPGVPIIREFRTRLVADVVTGKLDVREAAARLPDEAPVEGDTADAGDLYTTDYLTDSEDGDA